MLCYKCYKSLLETLYWVNSRPETEVYVPDNGDACEAFINYLDAEL